MRVTKDRFTLPKFMSMIIIEILMRIMPCSYALALSSTWLGYLGWLDVYRMCHFAQSFGDKYSTDCDMSLSLKILQEKLCKMCMRLENEYLRFIYTSNLVGHFVFLTPEMYTRRNGKPSKCQLKPKHKMTKCLWLVFWQADFLVSGLLGKLAISSSILWNCIVFYGLMWL